MHRRVVVLHAVLAATVAIACAKDGPSPEEQTRLDAERDRKLAQEVEAALAPYRAAAEAFLSATGNGDFEGAYALLAPSYTNMVTKETFVERIKANKNFAKAHSVKVLHTSSQAGTTKARCIVGDLGLWEVTFLDGASGPRVAGITIGGMPALPSGA